MSFKVRAKLVGFLGNIDRYPCHFCHKIGDEVIFDGEKYIGRCCPDVWPLLVPKVTSLHVAGPRYIEPGHYYPFWYCSLSKEDPKQKKYDGLGFRNVLETVEEPPFHMAHLLPPNGFKWPPYQGDVAKDVAVICPDYRSSALFSLEAFDLSEKGFDTAYFRRQMMILFKLQQNGNTDTQKILDLFSQSESEDIYPPLSVPLINRLVQELDLMGYLKIENDQSCITQKGILKFKTFKEELLDEDREALGID